MAGAKTENLTILLTDIEDFTPKTSRKTRADIVRMIDEYKMLVLPALEARGGRLIKTIGDAFLVVFTSPTDAVLAGVEVQRLLRQHNEHKQGDDRLDVRIAINSGEVTLADNDVFGEPVNVTSRINGIAETGEVFFTEAVYLAMNKMEVPSSEVGLLQLKGIAEKIRVYKVVREKPVGDSANKSYSGDSSRPADREDYRERTASQPATAAPTPRRRRRIAALALDAAFCAFFIGALFSPQSPVQIELGDTDSSAAVADDVTIDDKGVRVGDDVEISADRIRVGEALRLDQDGLKIDSEKFDQKTGKELGVAIDALLKEKDRLEALEGPELVSFSLFWFIYSTFFVSVWSATPGKRLFGLRIVRADGSPLDWKVALVRSLFSVLSGNFVMLGYAWGFFRKDRRTWHDLIAGTKVIKV